ncbi:DUF4962 domain-containing protein [Candidatus Poribacteria bacterium]|nr:DUF4962 domain-containing protein [Candidatus Poribacteria bacterium]
MYQEITLVILSLSLGIYTANAGEGLRVNDDPAKPGEWGIRPFDNSKTAVNPPGFIWRPQENAVSYNLQLSRKRDFSSVDYEKNNLKLFCHCPPKKLGDGDWYWRFAYTTEDGQKSSWSNIRRFTIPVNTQDFPMPEKEELFGRIPDKHPRLFLRPEDLPKLRDLAQGELKDIYQSMVSQCEKIMSNPPSTEEPPTYPEGTERLSEEWREIWWGNRRYTINVLNSAATLAFTRLLGGKEEYGLIAKKLLMDAAEWDPKGATGYRYNDEAGMPYNYYFSRTYTFVNDLLTEEEKEKCREIMNIRGKEMYNHLCPNHLWKPYGSHSNRAWHFLGEIAIAFFDEIPETRDWLWFTMNVFYNAYPVWSDDDGGWHEGLAYWRSYIRRFLWWADIMRSAMDIDAYKKPYFSKVGYYPMYLQPPGAKRGGFGDLTGHLKSDGNVDLMNIFAAQAQNPYWQWYVKAHDNSSVDNSYAGFIRGALPKVMSKPPVDLPDSRLFKGTGLAMLHTDLTDATNDIFIEFKSSPFGSYSHGYDSQNSFVLYAYSEPLLIRSGRRDIYGSAHHKNWMWETKSVNSILVNGQGQKPLRSMEAQGEIIDFHTSECYSYVVGEAKKAYEGRVKTFTRSILFIKPEVIVIYDHLETPEPSTFQWLMHSPNEMEVADQKNIILENGEAGCKVSFMLPDGLEISQTNKFDPPPRPRVKLTQWHLQASTVEKKDGCNFITIIRPYKKDMPVPMGIDMEKHDSGYVCDLQLIRGKVKVIIRTAEKGSICSDEIETNARVTAVRFNNDNKVMDYFTADGDIFECPGKTSYK